MESQGFNDNIINLYTNERYLTRKEILFRLKNRPTMDFNLVWEKILNFRKGKGNILPLKDQKNNNFWYMIPPFVEKQIHEINFVAKHRLEEITTKELHKKILIDEMMFEEAFYSSVIEGAFTTKKRAKEVVKTKSPKDKSEQMILNNYNALVFILENIHKDLNEDIFIQIHKIVTLNTLEKDEETERYRDDQVYVSDPNQTEPIYIPPKAPLVEPMMNDLFTFINNSNEGQFVQPIVKAFIIHFYIGYVHPFFDGNGRVARAFSFMYLLKQGYEFFKFFSISSIINKHRKNYYKSFIDSEENNNDITYFITAHLDITLDSIREVIDKLLREFHSQILEERLNKDGILLSSRQQKYLNLIERKETNITTIEEYRKKFKISYETARRDLMELESLGMFKKLKKGKKNIYIYLGLKGYLNED